MATGRSRLLASAFEFIPGEPFDGVALGEDLPAEFEAEAGHAALPEKSMEGS